MNNFTNFRIHIRPISPKPVANNLSWQGHFAYRLNNEVLVVPPEVHQNLKRCHPKKDGIVFQLQKIQEQC